LKTALINLHGRGIRPGDVTIREDGEVIIHVEWIYIGRAVRDRKTRIQRIPESRWRNDYKEGRDGTLEEIIAKYEADTLANPELLARLQALKRKTPATKDSDCVTSLDASPLHAGKPSRENIRKESTSSSLKRSGTLRGPTSA
jgi:hypothetical protein